MAVKSTSHLAQQIFGQHLGNLLLNATASNGTIDYQYVQKGDEGDGKLGNLYFVATKITNTKILIVKLTNVDANDITVNTQIQGSSTSSADTAYILSASPGIDPSKVHNTLEHPNAASIKNASVPVSSGAWPITVLS